MPLASIQELEAALKLAKEGEKAALQEAQELQAHNTELTEHIRWLNARIRELENPKRRRTEDLGWLGKVIQVIDRVGRPMRSREIMHELKAIDTNCVLETVANPDTLLSVTLRRGVTAGRLKLFKVAGTRGAYYALEKWVDKKGNLPIAMRDEMF